MKHISKIQIELSEEKLEELDILKRELHLRTKKELFNNAVSLLKWAVKEVKSGRIIASMDEESQKYKELCMPVLSVASTK